jgi:uncharacterized protein (DUF58 family)
MDYASDGISKFDYGCTLTASLAYLILRQQDAAGVVTFSDHIESFIPPRAKRDYMLQIVHALEQRGPSGDTNVGKILEDIAGQIKRRGLVVLVSDLLDEPEQILKGLRLFRFKGNDVIVFHVLDRRAQSAVRRQYFVRRFRGRKSQGHRRSQSNPHNHQEVVQEFITQMRQQCHDSAIDYQLLSTATPLDQALSSYLSWRG